jgi:type IV pilus assembly protein PilA
MNQASTSAFLGDPIVAWRRKGGFSLLELLIVIAIILILAAIVIPNLLHARLAANESSAAGSLRAIASAEIAYYDAYPSIGYANTLPDLGGANPCTPSPTSACMLDSVLSAAIPGTSGKSGYQFLATGIAGGGFNSNYVAGATPIVYAITGNRNLCSTSEQILRMQNPGGGPPVTTLAACYTYPIAP